MKAPKKTAEKSLAGSTGTLVLIVALVVFVVVTLLVFAYVAEQDENDKQYIGLLGEARVLSQRLSKYASQATIGSEPGVFNKLESSNSRFKQVLSFLREGDFTTGMDPAPDDKAVIERLEDVETFWGEKFGENIETILGHERKVAQMRKTVEQINGHADDLLALSDEVATMMVSKDMKPEQIYVASRQLMLSQRFVNKVNGVLRGGEGAVTAADRFGRDAALFGRVVKGLLEGNPELGIERVEDAGVRAKLEEVNALFSKIRVQVNAILQSSPEMFTVTVAVFEVINASDALLDRISRLEKAYLAYTDKRRIDSMVGIMFGAVALLLLTVLGVQLRKDGMRRLHVVEGDRREVEERNKRNQQAIMRLLDEMGDLADGDLTVNATVTEDITGAIADSINYAIEALRTLVTAINDTAEKVSSAAQETRTTAMRLAEASDHQANEIATASTAVNEIAVSIEGVSKNADQLAEEAQRSVDTAKQGAEAVQKTIDGMDTIREQIQETSKRIKRLGESSQEIGDIVELINDIAEQTNILALNAAIQAAMAGDAGRGFAVVADEVQRLAERSADATKQIEALVKTIQTDTNEAVISMEQSTAGVVAGAKLAQDAGSALGTIDTVAAQLAELVENINEATRQQASAASNVSETMNVIQDITTQTSAGTNQTAASIGNLANMADELKRSVAGFKLPG